MTEIFTPYQIKLWCMEDNHFPEDEDYEGWGGEAVTAEYNENEISLDELNENEISLDELEDEVWEEDDDLEEI